MHSRWMFCKLRLRGGGLDTGMMVCSCHKLGPFCLLEWRSNSKQATAQLAQPLYLGHLGALFLVGVALYDNSVACVALVLQVKDARTGTSRYFTV